MGRHRMCKNIRSWDRMVEQGMGKGRIRTKIDGPRTWGSSKGWGGAKYVQKYEVPGHGGRARRGEGRIPNARRVEAGASLGTNMNEKPCTQPRTRGAPKATKREPSSRGAVGKKHSPTLPRHSERIAMPAECCTTPA
jgi:hypothetical protein